MSLTPKTEEGNIQKGIRMCVGEKDVCLCLRRQSEKASYVSPVSLCIEHELISAYQCFQEAGRSKVT